jgi:Ras-related protein Rab-8A
MSSMKVILVGDSGAGKTCLSCYRVNGSFEPGTTSTVMASCATIEERLSSGDIVSVTIWDTAGQEKFRSIAVPYYRNSNVAFVCYDVTSDEDAIRQSVASWAAAVRDHTDQTCKLVLVGTKGDLLREEALTGALNFGESLAKELKMPLFSLTSAVTGQGIVELFSATAAMYQRPGQREMPKVDIEPQEKKKKKCC